MTPWVSSPQWLFSAHSSLSVGTHDVRRTGLDLLAEREKAVGHEGGDEGRHHAHQGEPLAHIQGTAWALRTVNHTDTNMVQGAFKTPRGPCRHKDCTTEPNHPQ